MAKEKQHPILPQTRKEIYAILDQYLDAGIDFTFSRARHSGIMLTVTNGGEKDDNIKRAALVTPQLFPSTIHTQWGKTFYLHPVVEPGVSATPDKAKAKTRKAVKK